jgi:hypothetical protein
MLQKIVNNTIYINTFGLPSLLTAEATSGSEVGDFLVQIAGS